MAEATKIEWCDSTFNPWIGCTKVSPACDDCYAARSTPARAMGITWGPGQARHRTSTHAWREPLRWEKYHHTFEAANGRRRRVFCASLADVFDNDVPPIWRAELFDLIKATPHLDWLLLTKRIGNAWKMMADALGVSQMSFQLPLPNVWLGATVVNQEEADRDIPKLLATPARVRFLSMEPLLGPVKLGGVWFKQHRTDGSGIDWVIVGGESGHGARPMHPDWARSLRDQCAAAGVPFLLKQWGEWRAPLEDEEFDTSMGRAQKVPAFIVAPAGTVHCFENGEWTRGGEPMLRVGKKAAGRQLDGAEHNGFPGV